MIYEVWVKESCNVAGGGQGCIVGESHKDGSHGRQVDDAHLRDVLDEVIDRNHNGFGPADPVDLFKELLWQQRGG